jgi:hypothetical protein
MLPRHVLPQIPPSQIENFKKFLNGHDISSSYVNKSISEIKPIQKHASKEKIQRLMQSENILPIIISKSGYILDGHHRFLAEKQLGHDYIKCLECNCNIRKLLEMGLLFPGSEIKQLGEVYNG